MVKALQIAKYSRSFGINTHNHEMNLLWKEIGSINKNRFDKFRNIGNSKEAERLLNYDVRDVTEKLLERLPDYLKEIEDITRLKIGKRQRRQLNDYIMNNRIIELPHSESTKLRSKFNNKRTELIMEWQYKTGQEWPTYKNNVLNRGKIVRRIGGRYDAHHIIENSYGGPPRWWNIHPASHPFEHQQGIHAKHSIATEIFDKDLLYRDVLNRDVLNRDALKRDVLNKDVLNRDALNRDALNRDALNRDALNRDALNRDAFNRDVLNRDVLNKDVLNRDVLNRDELNRDVLNKHVLNNGDITSGAGQRDDVHHIIENSYEVPLRLWKSHRENYPFEHQK